MDFGCVLDAFWHSEDYLADSVAGLNISVRFGQVFEQVGIALSYTIGNHALVDQLSHFLQDLAVFFLNYERVRINSKNVIAQTVLTCSSSN